MRSPARSLRQASGAPSSAIVPEVGPLQKIQAAKKGTLAGSRRTNHRDDITFLCSQRYAFNTSTAPKTCDAVCGEHWSSWVYSRTEEWAVPEGTGAGDLAEPFVDLRDPGGRSRVKDAGCAGPDGCRSPVTGSVISATISPSRTGARAALDMRQAQRSVRPAPPTLQAVSARTIAPGSSNGRPARQRSGDNRPEPRHHPLPLAVNIHASPQFESAAGAALRNDLVGKGLGDCAPRLGQGLIERLSPGDIGHEQSAASGKCCKRKYTLQRNRCVYKCTSASPSQCRSMTTSAGRASRMRAWRNRSLGADGAIVASA